MKLIKILLFKILKVKTYLSIVSKIYICIINLGIGKKSYSEIYFLKKIIKKDDVCIDIGANLGYYSYFLSKYSGRNGHLYAIEPVDLFAEIWKRNMKKSKYKNYTLYQYALGDTEKTVKMGTPVINGVFHHGMTKILENNTDENLRMQTDVEMRNPDVLFENIKKIDFIKADAEGYEHIIFKNMHNTLVKHKPAVIQTELSGEDNRKKVIDFLSGLSYNPHILINGKLCPASKDDMQNHNNDFYFILTEL